MEITCHCGSKYVVNKKYKLCNECNHLRLHGESVFDTKNKQNQKYLDKQKENNKTRKVQIKQTKIKLVTKKQSLQTNKLLELKNKIREKAYSEERYYCWSCGTTDSIALDCSHIISVSKRKDLELEEENINLFCRQCHIDWEANNIEKIKKMKTLTKDLEYIKRVDSTEYQKILHKLN